MKLEQRWQLVDGPLAGLALSATFEVDGDGQWFVRLYCTGPVEGPLDIHGDSPQWWATYLSHGQRFEETLMRVEEGEGWDANDSLIRKPSLADDRCS